MTDNLRAKLIRLAHSKPELRAEILPLLQTTTRAAAPTLVAGVKAWLKDFKPANKKKEDLEPLLFAIEQYASLVLHDIPLRTFIAKARGKEAPEDTTKKTAASPLDRVRGHELMPSSIKSKIPAMRAQEEVADPIAYVKFFSPYSGATWYITEFDKRDEMFGWADLGFGEGELGYISLSELASANSNGLPLVERDTLFRPTLLSKLK